MLNNFFHYLHTQRRAPCFENLWLSGL